MSAIKYTVFLKENKLVATDYKDIATVIVPHRIPIGGERHEFEIAPGDIIITGVIPEDEPHTLALRLERVEAIEGEKASTFLCPPRTREGVLTGKEDDL
jgi:hypothetical protein